MSLTAGVSMRSLRATCRAHYCLSFALSLKLDPENPWAINRSKTPVRLSSYDTIASHWLISVSYSVLRPGKQSCH
jgi:hypothetical protein